MRNAKVEMRVNWWLARESSFVPYSTKTPPFRSKLLNIYLLFALGKHTTLSINSLLFMDTALLFLPLSYLWKRNYDLINFTHHRPPIPDPWTLCSDPHSKNMPSTAHSPYELLSSCRFFCLGNQSWGLSSRWFSFVFAWSRWSWCLVVMLLASDRQRVIKHCP